MRRSRAHVPVVDEICEKLFKSIKKTQKTHSPPRRVRSLMMKTSTCDGEDGGQRHAGSRCAGLFSLQPRADEQVSAWIGSINPTPRLEAVDQKSSVCLYP